MKRISEVIQEWFKALFTNREVIHVSNLVELKTLKKGSSFWLYGRRFIKHVYDRTNRRYICLLDADIWHLSGSTLVKIGA